MDIEWDGGRVRKIGMTSRLGGEVVLRFDVKGNGGGSIKMESGEGGEVVQMEMEEGGRFRVLTERGGRYEFEVSWEG